MSEKLRSSLVLFVALSFALSSLSGCGHHGASHHGSAAPYSEGDEAQHAGEVESASAVHPVHCGCILDGIGKCGNYIEVEGEMLTLAGDIGLGEMEFCGQEGLTAEVSGSVVDGQFVATAFQLVE